ncbi:hypothetical protein OEZ85_005480 [Tetradesmus obliquus]|uniref:Uncharacterized protein n=1 Tax=Tetradesmus obliquus TaxID=3088 RepID=A0ABY8UKH0_TETOB|nr:hypothetical protein OEZ85_005480 [Tetradesmus obliquus]
MWEVEQANGSALQLRLCSRIPSIHSIHAVNMLAHVSVLDTAAASRGAVSVGWPGSVQQAAAALPALRTAHLNSSQASLVELLLHAAPQLSRIELAVTGVTPTVVRLLAQLPALASLELQLAHLGWQKACAGLGGISQLTQLSIVGRPMDEAARHGEGCVSAGFWAGCIAPLGQLRSLSVNPWIKAVPGVPSASYSSLGRLQQLSVPYCSGKAGQGATAATLGQLAAHCSELTALTIGVHEFNWDVSGLAALTGLVSLELHNPFLKEVWGLAPCTAAHLAPLTAARHLTSLTISTLRLPLLSDVMAAAGLAPGAAALVSGPGKPAAAAAALAAVGGPAFGDMLPVLLRLRRLTVGTTHGKFMAGVSLAALAPNLTCFEDLSEIMRQPLYATDALAGLSQLKLLTVNVDTLQLHLRCLRLLMLGHVAAELLPGEGGRLLPRVAGITRLELCSAFGGQPEYAATYSIAEDPALWQEQVGVRELVVDGGVLLGGFLVDAGMAALLTRQMSQLATLVLARCPDLCISHLRDAVARRLAPRIVVRRDCSVSEAEVVALAQGLARQRGVVLEMASAAPGEYADRSYTYAVDD